MYVDIVLDNGVRWRIDLHTRTVQEIEEHGARLEVRGPVTLDSFLRALEAEKTSRHTY